MRFFAGSKGMSPWACTNTLNVAVIPSPIGVTTASRGANAHCAVVGSVGQTPMVKGRLAPPASAETVMLSPLPKFDAATAKAPASVREEMSRMPLLPTVAATATMSGTRTRDADRKTVFTPGTDDAGLALVQLNVTGTSRGSSGSAGV